MLFVDPKYFKQQIGRKLLEFVIEKHNIDEVDVNEQNPNAVGFYKHMGFETIGRSELDSSGKPFPILHLKIKN